MEFSCHIYDIMLLDYIDIVHVTLSVSITCDYVIKLTFLILLCYHYIN